jgi:hypothetical protein
VDAKLKELIPLKIAHLLRNSERNWTANTTETRHRQLAGTKAKQVTMPFLAKSEPSQGNGHKPTTILLRSQPLPPDPTNHQRPIEEQNEEETNRTIMLSEQQHMHQRRELRQKQTLRG